MPPSDQSLLLPFKQNLAFVIGINAYEHLSPLTTAVKDANDIADLLGDEKKHGYKVHRLLDAGKRQMEEMFLQMKSLVKAEDRVIFYFAGHGIAIDSEGDPRGYLVPADANPKELSSLIPMDLLHQTLSDLPCKHGLLILDCCFAGSFKWSTGFRSVFFQAAETLYAERFRRFVDNPAWQVITSSAHDQKAADLLDKQALGLREEDNTTEDQNSPFAWALKQAIDLHSKADTAGHRRSDGVITATELYLYLRDIVETATHHNGKRQSPAYFTLGKHDSKGEYIFLNPGHPLNLPEAPNRNPYKGLKPFEPEDDDVQTFFGRDQAIRELRQKLRHTSILVVSAPSGQGKSSVVKAGLFPQLQKQGYESLQVLRPEEQGNTGWETLAGLDPAQKQVVLIDQYEEMFTLEDFEREMLEQRLKELLERIQQFCDEHQGDPPPLRLILTIRSDFEWQLQTSAFGQGFWQEENIRSFLYRLPPMTLEEMRESMTKPAWVVAYEFESEAFVDQILEEINHAPGALPLLSFTLHQLFENRDREKRLLTQKAYVDELGGVNGALSNYAEGIYLSLPGPAHQDFMRKILLRMVRLNDGSYTRRRIYLRTPSRIAKRGFIDELDYPDHLDQTKDEVLQLLEEAFLLRNGQDNLGPYVEPMHDSLINFWPRCLQWIQDFGRENLVLQRDLWKAVVEHHNWQEDIYGAPDGREPRPPLWDNNPKLQQVQIAVTDPRSEWLCQKGWAEKSISSVSFLMWEREPSSHEVEETTAWDWFFQPASPEERYRKIQEQMDHWLNEEELAFVKRSFEEQRNELERIKAERNQALKDKERAEELAHNLGLQTVAFKQKYQQRSKRDLLLIQMGLKPELHLLAVGIDKYEKFPLQNCVKDARNLAAVIRGQEGKLYEKVHWHPLLDQEATKENILQKIRAVRSQVHELHHVIIYLAGHGTIVEDGQQPGKKMGVFIPYSKEDQPDMLSSTVFMEELTAFPSPVILLLDFAYSADFLHPLIDANQSRDINLLTNNIFALSGTSPGQQAFEGPDGGFFSIALQQCYTTREADLDGNGMVYLDEALRFTAGFVEQKSSNRQQPMGVVPPTLTNIPLVQFGDTFALPQKELALGGHIEEDHVIRSIVQSFADEETKDSLRKQGFGHFIDNVFFTQPSTR